ncbi:MAG: CotH kinase family protein, partial [Paludibacteraceae bacterium]|nr:CotH kinase family protein [Paludibacteraceae bacterium]
ASIQITEVMPCNLSSYLDRNSWNFPGYIEFYNSGNETVSLKGYRIVHYSRTSKGKYKYKWEWIVPYDFEVKSKSYGLMFFDKDSTKTFHSSKKLDSDGGQICVYNGEEMLEEFYYEPMEAHVAYGIGEKGKLGYMEPSPKEKNGLSYSSLKDRVSPVCFKGASPGYQESSVSLSLVCGTKDATIYYTTDGSEPTKNSLIYNDSISDMLFDSTVCIKARAYSDSLLPSDILSGTFIFMDEAHSSCGGFSVPIVSVSVDDKYLYDDSIGIAVKGANGILGNGTTFPANFNQDWERPAVFEYFVDGKRVVCEDVEIAVSGGSTRSYTNIPKSLKIKTGKKIGSSKEYFNYDFFQDKLGGQYKSLKIRVGGNAHDAFSLRFRDGYFQTLAREMNVDYQAYQPVAYYLNGAYQGMMGLREHLNDDYIVSNFGLEEESIDMIKTHEVKEGDKMAYNTLVSFLDNNNPLDATYYDQASKMMDMEEYIDYMIIEQFSANADWPGNNIMCWRDRNNGKFRWILYDMDVTMGCSPSDVSIDPIKWCTGDVEEKTWANDEKWKVVIFSNLIKNPQFKKRFINRWMMYLGTTLSRKNIESVYDSLATVVEKEFCATFDGLSPLDCPGRAFLMKKTDERIQTILSSIGNIAGYKWNVGLSFSSNVPGVKFEMNDEVVNRSSFSGFWFNSGELKLRAIAPANYRFVRWDVRLADTSYSVKDEVFIKSIKRKCTLNAIFDTCECQSPTVVINEMCASSDSSTTILDDYGLFTDWVELYNYGEDTVDVAGLYLTDKITKLTKYQIPYSYENTKIAPHDYLMVWADGMSYRGGIHTNFKIENGTGAKLAIAQKCGDSIIVLDQVTYKKMTTNASYGRIVDASDEWTLFSPYKDTLLLEELLFATPMKANGLDTAAFLVCPSDTVTRKVYDGMQLAPIAYVKGGMGNNEISIEYSTDEGLIWNSEVPSIVNSDTMKVKVRATYPEHKTVECGYEMAITAAEMDLVCPMDTTKVYDGAYFDMVAYAEGISSADSIKVEYSKDEGKTWDTIPPVMKNVGVQPVKVRATHPNYKTMECGYEMAITAAEMDLVCPMD